MANKTTKPSAKSQTVRERTKTGQTGAKKRRVQQTAKVAGKPIKATGKGLKQAAKPLSFILKPFKTKPFRFVGRILSKVFFIGYIRSSWEQLRQVTWPTRQETAKLTLAVFIFAIVFGIAIAVVDYGLDKIFKRILLS